MKILFLVSRFPFPLEKGDKLRAFQHLQLMHKLGHEVHLVALSDIPVTNEAMARVSGFCASVHVLPLSKFRIGLNLAAGLFRRLPLQVAYFYSKLHAGKIYCQLIRTAAYVKELDIPGRIIDYQDAFSLGTHQRMLRAPWWIRPLYSREYRLVADYEAKAFHWFNAHLVISEQDRKAMCFENAHSITLLPNGVDTSWFAPGTADKKFDITFIGNMNYPPNVDSAVFLVRDIMPKVWKVFPGAKVLIAGANPHPRIQSLSSARIEVSGWVDDIRNCYASARLFAAPMRMGTGLQNKLLEAMSMELAVVTTPLSAIPVGAPPGIGIVSAETADDLGHLIIDLLENGQKRKALGQEGRKFVMNHFSLEHAAKVLQGEFIKLKVEREKL
jgi:glycosyltransferase involved in cell wall biosynthesis